MLKPVVLPNIYEENVRQYKKNSIYIYLKYIYFVTL